MESWNGTGDWGVGVLLVLHGVVVALLALCASERHLDTGSSFSHIFRHLLIDFAPVGT